MPSAIIQSFASKSGKSTAEVEELWNRIKKALKESGMKESENGKFFGTLVKVLKKKLKINDSIMKKYQCPKCDNLSDEATKFCSSCGIEFAPLNDEQVSDEAQDVMVILKDFNKVATAGKKIKWTKNYPGELDKKEAEGHALNIEEAISAGFEDVGETFIPNVSVKPNGKKYTVTIEGKIPKGDEADVSDADIGTTLKKVPGTDEQGKVKELKNGTPAQARPSTTNPDLDKKADQDAQKEAPKLNKPGPSTNNTENKSGGADTKSKVTSAEEGAKKLDLSAQKGKEDVKNTADPQGGVTQEDKGHRKITSDVQQKEPDAKGGYEHVKQEPGESGTTAQEDPKAPTGTLKEQQPNAGKVITKNTAVKNTNDNRGDSYCGDCGVKLFDDGAFCPGCGKPLNDANNLLKQDKLSSEEYQKAKKMGGFNKKDWKWNPDEDLYVKQK
jgi:ribosomal protein L37AE/L43A